ncbi:MAG: hypothetical protein J7L66_03350, partial [Anaerolineaceae bacterium]|nr:hypothetical protein [Anaerolineaceae bacterium]
MHSVIPAFKAGIYEYKHTQGEYKKRIHLRIEKDGYGVLLINASQMYHFNPSASLMAFLLLEKIDDKKAIKQLQATFNVKKKKAIADFRSFKADFERIVSPVDNACPICDLNLETFAPFSKQPSAPYRMDLALTYRCNNNCIHCYNEASRAKSELSIDQWKH